jgi:aspartate kinase
MTKQMVYKFGGSSVRDSEAFLRSARLCLAEKSLGVAVISATYNTTNRLEFIDKNPDRAHSLMNDLQAHHERILEEIAQELKSDAKDWIAEYRLKVQAPYQSLKGHDDPGHQLDWMYSYGEWASSFMMTKTLQALAPDRSFIWFDARDVIITSEFANRAEPLLSEMEKRVGVLQEALKQGVVITQGFIGKSLDGITTTLGREGSDYSAALFGRLIQAQAVVIWTDVPGIASFDPRLCSDAKFIDHMSYEEAEILATGGAKVLFPRTLAPVREQGIDVWVRSSYEPECGGTIITQKSMEGFAMAVRNHENDELVSTLTLICSRPHVLKDLRADYPELLEVNLTHFGATVLVGTTVAMDIVQRLHADLNGRFS